MKTKILLVTALFSAGLLTSATTFARGPGKGGAGGRGQSRGDNAACDLSGPGQGTPQRDGSGRSINNQGNSDSKGTPVRDGSGKTNAPGKGPKDGSGNAPRHPTG